MPRSFLPLLCWLLFFSHEDRGNILVRNVCELLIIRRTISEALRHENVWASGYKDYLNHWVMHPVAGVSTNICRNLRTQHRHRHLLRTEVSTYMDYVFLTSAMVLEWSAWLPGRFIAVKDPPHPLDRRLGGPQSRSRRYGDSNSDPSVVQPVASRYTDCATVALHIPADFYPIRAVSIFSISKNTVSSRHIKVPPSPIPSEMLLSSCQIARFQTLQSAMSAVSTIRTVMRIQSSAQAPI
jgi:hypothetical protein